MSPIKKRDIVTNMKIGIYFNPNLALPFFIVAIIIAEKNEEIIKDTTANMRKSAYCMPAPENESANPVDAVELPTEDPRFPITLINTPESAKSRGAAAIVAKDMNIT